MTKEDIPWDTSFFEEIVSLLPGITATIFRNGHFYVNCADRSDQLMVAMAGVLPVNLDNRGFSSLTILVGCRLALE